MDLSWMSYFGTFWVFPVLCLVFMIVMMIACGALMFRFGHCGRSFRCSESPSRVTDGAHAGRGRDHGVASSTILEHHGVRAQSTSGVLRQAVIAGTLCTAAAGPVAVIRFFESRP